MIDRLLEADSTLPTHNHPYEQGGIVLEVTLELRINEEIRTLVPGDIYIFPGGVDNTVIVEDNPARVLDVFLPVSGEHKD